LKVGGLGSFACFDFYRGGEGGSESESEA
jgi:hypothetical protein